MSETPEDVRTMVRARFAGIANSPTQERRFPVGPESAKALGYDPTEIDQLPCSLTESFAGVGNPLALGQLQPGETVLDIGCGAGLDTILAARRIGPMGKAIGVDMTGEMVQKARRNARTLGLGNAEFVHAEIELLPMDDNSIDVAVSNGVFNLCPDKPKALAETYRVLRPGGRLLMADILLEEHVTPAQVARLGTWSD
jgi:arsenite methyltransferase